MKYCQRRPLTVVVVVVVVKGFSCSLSGLIEVADATSINLKRGKNDRLRLYGALLGTLVTYVLLLLH